MFGVCTPSLRFSTTVTFLRTIAPLCVTGKEATLTVHLDVRYASRLVTNLRYAVQAS
jgi:hypothetical protein